MVLAVPHSARVAPTSARTRSPSVTGHLVALPSTARTAWVMNEDPPVLWGASEASCPPSPRTCPLLCPRAPSSGAVEPNHSGIIIRVSGVRVPPPASRFRAEFRAVAIRVRSWRRAGARQRRRRVSASWPMTPAVRRPSVDGQTIELRSPAGSLSGHPCARHGPAAGLARLQDDSEPAVHRRASQRPPPHLAPSVLAYSATCRYTPSRNSTVIRSSSSKPSQA
jgi:hypothetical protein